jgi:hypothetical protein
MLGKAERSWRTLRDSASALLHGMSVPNSMLSCVISTVVYLRKRMLSRAVGACGDVPLTLLTSSRAPDKHSTRQASDASKFRSFGCIVIAKVPDKLRRKLGEKAFRGIMVGYPHDAPGYRIYNHATRRITTSVHVVFQDDVPGFSPTMAVDSLISDATDMDIDRGSAPTSHPLDLDQMADEDLNPDSPAAASTSPLPDHDHPSRLRSHPIRYGEIVAHLSDHPRVIVATCCDP